MVLRPLSAAQWVPGHKIPNGLRDGVHQGGILSAQDLKSDFFGRHESQQEHAMQQKDRFSSVRILRVARGPWRDFFFSVPYLMFKEQVPSHCQPTQPVQQGRNKERAGIAPSVCIGVAMVPAPCTIVLSDVSNYDIRALGYQWLGTVANRVAKNIWSSPGPAPRNGFSFCGEECHSAQG